MHILYIPTVILRSRSCYHEFEECKGPLKDYDLDSSQMDYMVFIQRVDSHPEYSS